MRLVLKEKSYIDEYSPGQYTRNTAGLEENKMKLVIREKMEVTEEGIGSTLKKAAAGVGLAAGIAGAGGAMATRAGNMDDNLQAAYQLKQANIPGPTMARGYLKATGKEFSPVYGNYKMELELAVAALINSGKLELKDGKLIVTGK